MSTILIADDEPDIREILHSWLSDQGHHITCVASGEAAIETIPRIKPDLVITDIRMQVVDGYQVLAVAKQFDPAMAVIIMSGHKITAQDVLDTLNLGADDHLSKPFHLRDLDRSVQHALNDRQARMKKM